MLRQTSHVSAVVFLLFVLSVFLLEMDIVRRDAGGEGALESAGCPGRAPQRVPGALRGRPGEWCRVSWVGAQGGCGVPWEGAQGGCRVPWQGAWGGAWETSNRCFMRSSVLRPPVVTW